MKYFIQTFGCQMNFSDSERMMTFFEQNNFVPASKIEEADLAIFNTCGVRQTAEDRVFSLVHKLRIKNKKAFIVLTGCLSHRQDVKRKMKGKVDLYLPISEITKIFQHLPDPLKPASTCIPDHYLFLNPQYKYSDMAFVPIMTGCNNFCSYCVVPYARGREWSRPLEDILKELEILSNQGRKKITLLGQNVNSYLYNFKIQSSKFKTTKQNSKLILVDKSFKFPDTITFPILLNLLAKTYSLVTFKFLTSHPKDYSDELIEVIANNDNISKDIHLPVQSGSDKILKAMNRPYTQAHYLNLVEKTKKKIPTVRFSTDVIVGFPGETEEDFLQTVKVFEKVGFYEAFLNKYSPRPGTAAYKLENNISWEEKKRREKVLRNLVSQ